MRKSVAFILILVVALIVSAAQYFVQDHFKAQTAQRLENEIAILEATIDSIGPVVECYTVTKATYPGQVVTEDCLTMQSVPSSFINDSYVMDKEQLLGKIFKISIIPGTPITEDILMTEDIEDTTRVVDLIANRWPTGLEVGDYIDFRITYPMGEDFVVLSHKRVYQLGEETFQVYLTEEEQHRVQAVLVDYYLTSALGSDIYITQYVEPGYQEPATVYYAIPENIENIMLLDPNIVDKAVVAVNTDLRPEIDAILEGIDEEAAKLIVTGRSNFNSLITGDFGVESKDEEEEDVGGGSWLNPSTSTDISTGVDNVLGEGVLE